MPELNFIVPHLTWLGVKLTYRDHGGYPRRKQLSLTLNRRTSYFLDDLCFTEDDGSLNNGSKSPLFYFPNRNIDDLRQFRFL